MDLSKIAHLPLAAVLATLIMVGMPALARLQPRPADDPWTRNRPATFPAFGRLVYEGRPVENAIVMFVPEPGEDGRQYTAFGTTDKAGRFLLRTFSSSGSGAIAGMHRVKVECMVPTGRILMGPMHEKAAFRPTPVPVEDGVPGGHQNEEDGLGYPEMRNILPERFADPYTSGLTARVMADDSNEYVIMIHADPPLADDVGAAVGP